LFRWKKKKKREREKAGHLLRLFLVALADGFGEEVQLLQKQLDLLVSASRQLVPLTFEYDKEKLTGGIGK
jgi:hypothetical protein